MLARAETILKRPLKIPRQTEKPFGHNSLSELLRDLKYRGLVFTSPDWEYQQNVTPEAFELLVKESSPEPVRIIVRGVDKEGEPALGHPIFEASGAFYQLSLARFTNDRMLITMDKRFGKGLWENKRLGLSYTRGIPEIRQELRDLLDPKAFVWTRQVAGCIAQRLHKR